MIRHCWSLSDIHSVPIAPTPVTPALCRTQSQHPPPLDPKTHSPLNLSPTSLTSIQEHNTINQPLKTLHTTHNSSPTLDDAQDSTASITPERTLSNESKGESRSYTSVSEDEAIDLKTVNEKLAQGGTKKTQMVDTYGNSFELPDFSFNELRKAIPAHCFKRSAAWSLFYVARDIVQWAGLFWAFYSFNTEDYVSSKLTRGLLWFVYTVVAGWIGTGLWVLAPECGHGAFSDYKKLNDTVGFILHSALGAPYFSWQITHRKHHQNTGNLDKDMVFNPKTKERYASRLGVAMHEIAELAEDTPIVTLLTLIGQQLVGWNMYLCTNTTGHDVHENAPNGRGKGKKNGLYDGVNHFNPSSPLFDEKDMPLIWLSDIGLLITAAVVTFFANKVGAWNMFVYYGAPYLWVNNWLVWITYLQHTDPTLPHYEPGAWTFTRGAAATIDREFGFIGRYFMHGIVETHVVHHYFSSMPFYNADEATEAVKPIMGRHYRSDTKGGILGFIRAIWISAKHCQWVEPNEGAEGEAKGVYFFRNRNGLGMFSEKKKVDDAPVAVKASSAKSSSVEVQASS